MKLVQITGYAVCTDHFIHRHSDNYQFNCSGANVQATRYHALHFVCCLLLAASWFGLNSALH